MLNSPRWSILLLLLSFQAARAADPPDNASKPTPEQSKAQLQRIQSRIHQLEAQMYAQDPSLKQVQADYKKRSDEFAAWQAGRASRVSTYLQTEDQKRGDQAATKAYRDLYSEWISLAAADALNDPKLEQLYKTVLTSKPEQMRRLAQELKQADHSANPADPDQLWTAYKAAILKNEPRQRERIQKKEQQSCLPQYILDYARRAGINKFLADDLYFPYIELKTPQPLKHAREEEKLLLQSLESPPQE